MWLDEDSNPETDVIVCDSQDPSPQVKLIEAYLMFIFLWQTTFRLSDVGITVLLSFVAVFMLLLAEQWEYNPSRTLPATCHEQCMQHGNSWEEVRMVSQWVCCPSCSKLYSVEECTITLPDGSKSSRQCSYIK